MRRCVQTFDCYCTYIHTYIWYTILILNCCDHDTDIRTFSETFPDFPHFLLSRKEGFQIPYFSRVLQKFIKEPNARPTIKSPKTQKAQFTTLWCRICVFQMPLVMQLPGEQVNKPVWTLNRLTGEGRVAWQVPPGEWALVFAGPSQHQNLPPLGWNPGLPVGG